MAAFEHVPVKWLVVAGSAVVVVIVAIVMVLLLTGPSKPNSSAASGPGRSTPSGPGAPASASPGGAPASASPGSTGTANAPGPGTAPGGANQAAPPASADQLRALLIDPPSADSTVDNEPIDDTTFEGARWGVTLFWTNPQGSMVLAQFGSTDQARAALTQYREGVHDSGICDETAVPGHADAYLCAAKGMGEGVNPGDIPAIGLGLKGPIVALVTASDPDVVQQLLSRQLDRLP